MPWQASDASRHTHKATTAKEKRGWSEAANKVLRETGDEGRAVRTGNYVVNRIKAAERKSRD